MRFYSEVIDEGPVRLGGAEAHHLIHVLRLSAGDEVELFDGRGGLARAVVERVGRRDVDLQAFDVQRHAARAGSRIVLAVSVAKGQRFDSMITQCTELGVDHILPTLFERTVRQPKGRAARERFDGLAVAAAKQCKRLFLPRIDDPMDMAAAMEAVQQDYPDAQRCFGGLGEERLRPADLYGACGDVVVFIGPEGGFTEDEAQRLRAAGAAEVRLNANVLRIETAAVAFSAVYTALRYARENSAC